MEIIICPKCHSEIAVENPCDYDIDCDCGMRLLAQLCHLEVPLNDSQLPESISDDGSIAVA